MTFGPWIDHHCHGVVTTPLDRPAFEALFSEAHEPHSPFFLTQFDKPLGLAIRRFCAPALDLEAHAPAEDYVARRLALGAEEANRRLLQAAGMETMLVDTGHRAEAIADPDRMAALSGAATREVVRIEAVMEEVARSGAAAAAIPDLFAERLAERARDAVGLKSIVAYRASFDIDQTRPAEADVLHALDRWLGRIARKGWRRLEDPTVLRHCLFVALDLCAERRFPLQLHVGFGDRDILMPRCDPTVFAPFIAEAERRAVGITLLHCYPFEREAAWLAEVYSNVFYDVGAVLNYTGPSARRVLADAMEMGPFTKQLYSSDAFGLAELHLLGRIQFERALKAVLDGWLADDAVTPADAERIARLVTSENARRLYRLDEAR